MALLEIGKGDGVPWTVPETLVFIFGAFNKFTQ